MTMRKLLLTTAMAGLTTMTPAMADETTDKQYVLDLGVGVMAQPRYPGSDETIFVPYPLIAVGKFFVPGYGDVGGGNEIRRLSVYPSFNFIGKRDAGDSNELEGMKDVDWSLEAGLGVAYRYDWLRGFVEVRQGFNGYSGQVAEFGFDVIGNPTEKMEVMVGPRAGWGSDDYMQTYFGITAKEAAKSPNFDRAYDASAGFSTVGVAANASYDLSDKLTLRVRGGWDRLIGDAGNSPLVKEGSANQFYGGVGLTHEFSFDLF
jgi:outer membrane scaffolding protein for murein synthesis (MipA/OmpV family)